MKTITFLFIAFLIFQLITPAQEGWNLKNSGRTDSFYSVDFINENTGWIAGPDDIIMQSSDGGQNWVMAPGRLFPAYSDWYSICFVNANEGYVCGNEDMGWYEWWWKYTTNGCYSWARPSGTFIPNTSRWTNVFFLNETLGWKVGYRNGTGRVIMSTTGVGSDWHSSTTVPEPLYAVMFVDENNGWMVGDSGAIYRSTDGGLNWALQNSGTTKSLKSVYFQNTSTGWSVGHQDDHAIILKTVNGGQSWTATLPSDIKKIHSVYFANANIGWACGSISSTPSDKGVILYTDDGGDNWVAQHIQNNCEELYDIDFVSSTVGWIVGSNGVILKTTTGGATGVYENKDYKLTTYDIKQNYPNPFNPTTTIKYQIPELSFVILKVYDVLGNEMETLVEEEKQAGTYELEWNANDLSSGVYFYQLKAVDPSTSPGQSFIETRKMILLR